MANKTPLEQAKELANQLTSILSFIDVDALSREEQRLVATLKRQLEDARLDARDYDFAETRAEQQRNATAARKNLEKLRANILKASEFNLFSAVDVAMASAHIEQLISDLQ